MTRVVYFRIVHLNLYVTLFFCCTNNYIVIIEVLSSSRWCLIVSFLDCDFIHVTKQYPDNKCDSRIHSSVLTFVFLVTNTI